MRLKNILQGNEGGAIKALRDAYFTPVAVDITEQLARNALNGSSEKAVDLKTLKRIIPELLNQYALILQVLMIHMRHGMS